MDRIIVDFSKTLGKVKPMHSVNNGPVHNITAEERQKVSNLMHFKAAGIPYARTHDSSSCRSYGGEHIVDVNLIFTDFDKDPCDPESYDFTLTDYYLQAIELAGTKVFYRLGSTIEHWPKKYNTLPPKDFHKWAVVCEHIIRHYTEGWADGFHMDIEYWEIWNEPDLDPDDSDNKRTWGGTAAEFRELFIITYKHLKSCFPHLKIGGPSFALFDVDYIDTFLTAIKENGIKPDFVSWHIYSASVDEVKERINAWRKLLDKHGLEVSESILNEWNYVRGWIGEEYGYSLKTEKKLKGAAFIAATICMAQYEPLDNLMFYDARPSIMNSLFSTDIIYERLKGYYPFYMFNQLYTQDSAVEVTRDSRNIWAAAAKGEEQNLMLAHFNDDDSLPAETVEIEFKNVTLDGKAKLQFFRLDEECDCELVREEIITSENFKFYVNMPIFTTYLIKLIKQ